MTCHGCHADNLVASSIQLCWCQAEFCPACMPGHVATCTAYAQPATVALSEGVTKMQKKHRVPAYKGGFEAVMSVMKHVRRGR